MGAAADYQVEPGLVHGGRLAARALRSRGVSHLFTLSGGHLFSLYDGCRAEGIEIVDVRHEQTAAFAAEGWAKATREVGVCALTAGPGVTNGISAIAGAAANGSPLLVLAGRAAEMRWGSGSLQEIDHLPFVSPLVKSARTVKQTAAIGPATAAAIDLARELPGGPTFLDYPLDVVFMEAESTRLDPPPQRPVEPADGVERVAALLAAAERPAVMAGSGLYWARAELELAALARAFGIPVFLNGLGRGCIAADDELAFSRTRSGALQEADLVLVIGAALDFRLGFGSAIGPQATLVRIDCEPNRLTANRLPEFDLVGDIAATLAALGAANGDGARNRAVRRLAGLRAAEDQKRGAERAELEDPRAPLHPMRIYGELAGLLDRDAIVVGDGGDFVSYAGRLIDTYQPGCWLDPGPFGCLGAGPGQAIGAKLARPDRQVCLLLGDGAFGFAGMEFDTMVRHGIPVVAIVGNNGIWALEKRPMEMLFGYSVAADLTPETRYDKVAEALGAHAELVRTPDQLRPALQRAFGCGGPAVVNVLTDPEVVYPRRAMLA